MSDNELKKNWDRVCAYLGFISRPWEKSLDTTVGDPNLRCTFIKHAMCAVLVVNGHPIKDEEHSGQESILECPIYFKTALQLLDFSIGHLIKR